MTKHTPGPWHCIETSYHAHDYRLTRPGGSSLPVNAPANDHSEQRANANLIAAAPDLLAALLGLQKEIRRVVQFDVKKHYSLMVADATANTAIRKATEGL